MALLSAYERKARLTPGLTGVAPIAITIATLGIKQFPAVAVVAGVLSAAGGMYLLAVLVGNFGRRAQVRLWAEWGGRPTTQLLRTRELADNPVQRDIWRKALSRVTGIRLLSQARETSDPATADHTIEAAVSQVLHLGQDKQFPILVAENAQYGLERNLYGFRWLGRAIALVCIAGLSVALLLTVPVSPGAVISGIIINSLLLLGWLFVPSEARTKEAGFRYANQLMQAVVRSEKNDSVGLASSSSSTDKGKD